MWGNWQAIGKGKCMAVFVADDFKLRMIAEDATAWDDQRSTCRVSR